MKKYYKIQPLRLEQGYTQEDMAEKLGISQNAYSKIENGKSNVKAETLKKIAVILGKKADELMEDEEKPVCQVKQHNSPNATGANIGSEVNYHYNDFETERAVWQGLEKSLLTVIEAKDELIAQMRKTMALLEGQMRR